MQTVEYPNGTNGISGSYRNVTILGTVVFVSMLWIHILVLLLLLTKLVDIQDFIVLK